MKKSKPNPKAANFCDSIKHLTDENTIEHIVNIQKHMRRILACNRLARRAEETKAKIEARREAMRKNPEGAALAEFVT